MPASSHTPQFTIGKRPHNLKKIRKMLQKCLHQFWLPRSDFSFPELNLQNMSHLLDKVFLIFPNYCLGMSFSQFYQNYEFVSFCTSSPVTRTICKFFSKCNLNIATCYKTMNNVSRNRNYTTSLFYWNTRIRWYLKVALNLFSLCFIWFQKLFQ